MAHDQARIKERFADARQRSRDEEMPRGGSQGMPFAKIEELQKVAYENRAGIRELRSRFLDLAR